ncbi:MAG TPA: hypothetical protein VNX65_04605 [Patescibacteria group bacterium]|nr:hypothetical protein [Patescibacteria group bacterium]
MNKSDLFTSLPDSQELVASVESSISPLGEYTLGEMPNDLAAVRDGGMSYTELRTKQEAVLTDVALQIAGNTDPHVATITQLDLAFMLGGYLPLEAHAYREAPAQLLGLLDQHADRFGLPARMDYELIIDINTEEYRRTGHMRTFTNGNTALAERDFYQGHHDSEVYVKAAAYQLRNIVEHPNNGNAGRIIEAASSNMRIFREYMATYMRLTKDDFGTMRPYLASYPDGIRNASGAFMPSVQLTELALHAPTAEQGMYMDESMRYFPRWARDILGDWREQSARGCNVLDLVTNGHLELDAHSAHTLKELVDEFLKFRTAHMAATRKQIPEAFEGQVVPVSRRQLAEFGEPDIMAGGAKGTAGFVIVNVLGGAAHRIVMAQQQLEATQVET